MCCGLGRAKAMELFCWLETIPFTTTARSRDALIQNEGFDTILRIIPNLFKYADAIRFILPNHLRDFVSARYDIAGEMTLGKD